MFCSKCGAKISDSAKFCPECGTVTDKSENFGKVEDVKIDEESKHSDDAIDSAPKNAGKLLYTARRSAWAASGKIVGFSVGILICLFLALLLFIGASEAGEDSGFMIGLGVVFVLLDVLFAVLLVFALLVAKSYKIEVYTNRLVVRSGFISKKVKQSVMTPIVGVEIEQSVSGRLWNYGYVYIDKVGVGWDVDCHYIKNPEAFKNFLETLIDEKAVDKLQMHIMN